MAHEHEHEHEGSLRFSVIRIVLTAVITLIAMFLPIGGAFRIAVFAVPYILISWDVLLRAAKNILRGEVFDECFLMTIASIGAFVVGEMPEGVAVMLFYQLGEVFEDVAEDRTRDAISKLTDVRPDTANVEIGGEITRVDARSVEPGAIIVVKPGERVPLDGVLASGRSELDQSALTGESLPRAVEEGDMALSGCVNLSGVIRVRVERGYSDSEVARVLKLVEGAADRKAKSEQFITKFARVYTPCVVLLALLAAFVPPIFTGDYGANFSQWLYRALIFLVVSCPCALVISVPLTFFAGIGALSKKGVLIKGGSYMDALARADIFAFDKTGTLTEGLFKLTDVVSDMPRAEFLDIMAHAESLSGHPLARAAVDANAKKPDPERVSDVEELPGRGLSALVDGRRVLVGNARLMSEAGVACPETSGTALHLAIGGEYAGHAIFADAPKPRAVSAIKMLKELGARRFVMLTGDTETAARAAAEQIGITEFGASLLPDAKVEHLDRIMREKPAKSALIFVGDGINDAPSLALADVGVAMGAMGSDAAIEAADVVLMDDNPEKLATAVKGSRRTLGIVRQNIVISLAVKLAVMVLGALGIAGMWFAVFADVGVCLVAILNATRAMRLPG